MPEKIISFFIPSLDGGGAERHAVNLMNAMVKKDKIVHLVVSQRVGKFKPLLDSRVKIFELNAISVLFSIPKLTFYLKKYKPTALFSLLSHANLSAFLALKLAHVRTQFFPGEHRDGVFSEKESTTTSIKEKLLFKIIKSVYRFFPTIITVSEGARQGLITYAKIPPEKVIVIYNAILQDDIESFSATEVNHSWFKQREMPVIVAAGRLSPEKNFPLLIHAMKLVNQKISVKCVILGQGPLHSMLESLIQENQLSNHVSLLGFQENCYSFLRACNLFVLSSYSESLSCVLVEALQLSPNVLSTDCFFGPSEVLGNGKWGYLVENNNVTALAEGIIDALQHPKIFPDKIESLKRFQSDTVADHYLSLLYE